MQDRNEPTSVSLDLSRYTEETRRELYDRLVRIQRVSPESWTDSGEMEAGPEYDPEASELMVFHAFGRWFATWTDLEAPEDTPEHLRREVVRIQPAPENPEGILLLEV